jgi:2,3-bisphosphoglycerate-dependent phosphoglycerate mutase
MPPVMFLLRHAESATPHIFHGAESDIELGATGHAQAAAAAEWFRSQSLTAVVSSNQLRARQTAAAIAEACRVPHSIEVDLHERIVGDLLGTVFAGNSGPWFETVQAWSRGETTYTTAGAESYDAIRERAVPAFFRVAATHPDGRVAVVSHGITIKVLLLTLMPEWGPQRWHEVGKVANTAVSELHAAGEHWHALRRLECPWNAPATASAAASTA